MVYFLFGSCAPHLQIKLTTYGSNLNSMFVIITKLELFLLKGVLTQSFNNVDLVKFLETNKKTSHLDCNGYIEVTSCKTMSKKLKKLKKVKTKIL
jgi:hypothetical protein